MSTMSYECDHLFGAQVSYLLTKEGNVLEQILLKPRPAPPQARSLFPQLDSQYPEFTMEDLWLSGTVLLFWGAQIVKREEEKSKRAI